MRPNTNYPASRTRLSRRPLFTMPAFRRRRFISVSLSFILGILIPASGFFRSFPLTVVQAAVSVFINEIHYDNTGTDAGEAIEIAGPAGTNLAGWSLVLYNGSGGASYNTLSLSGTIPNQQSGFGTLNFTYPVNGIQNGSPDGVALVNASSVVIQFLSYEGTFTATNGPASGMLSVDIGVSEDGTEALGQSLRLSGSGQFYEDFTWNAPAANTFGAVNTGQTFGTADAAPSVTSTSPIGGATNVAPGANIVINFSESVSATNSSFTIECPAAQTFSLSSSPSSTFTLDPTSDLPTSSTCTVTVIASQITDADTNDPPDQMVGDFVFSFATAAPPPTASDDVFINELDSDQTGTDTTEFIELYDGGLGNTALDGLVVVFYNGSNDLSYRVIDLDTFSTDAAGYFTIGNPAVPGVDLTFPNDTLQNGADAVALYAGDAPSFPTNTAVTTTNLKDALVYDTSDADDPGLLVLLNAGEPQVDENAGGGGLTNSIGRCPNGSGGKRNTSSYTARTPSPGGVNDCPPPPVAKTIMEIQGSGTASPFDGASVITTGIVTGRKTNGFFLQDPTGDGDVNTSDGIFVFTSSNPTVAVGDTIQVTGTVSEFESSTTDEPDGVAPPDPKTATEITGPTIVVQTSGNPLPAAVDSTALNIFDPTATSRGAELERYEFMRVHVNSITVSEPTNNFGEFWGVEPPHPRPVREPGIEAGDPIPAADEGPYAGSPPPFPPIFDGNFERVQVDSDDAVVSFGPLVRRPTVSVTTGTVVTGITGPLDYAFDSYRIVLDALATPGVAGGVTAATPVPVRTSGEFTIGHANLENFGVSNANFTDRLNKASLAIRNVLNTPDILGVIEVFDLPSLQQLAIKVNTDVGNPGGVYYQAYLDESASTFADSQDIGYLVNTARVTVVGAPVQYHRTDTFTYCGNTDLLHDRPSYVLSADVPQVGTAALLRVTVVLNHTKSLIAVDSPRPSGTCGTGTEGARNREKRRLQAEDIADLIESLQTENLVVLGDLNAFDFNDGLGDVVGTFKGDPAEPENVVEPSTDRWTHELTNLLTTVSPDQHYSLLFEGNAQALDHVLVNDKMLARNTDFAYARYNADFSESFAADANRPERLSDHDATVAYFSSPDQDNDGVLDGADNCPTVANADQADFDGDTIGDACDPDDDNDGVLDGADNCPLVANSDQANNDGDSEGDACDADDDNDGILDGADNCPLVANTDQANNDGDGLGDVCDPDDDNDGVLDGVDNCPFVSNSSQADFDGDGIGDACDPSPYDNIQIVFSSNRHGNFEIYGMKTDGTGVTRLTNNGASDLNPALSPDKSKIVFTSTRDGNFELYSMNANGTGVTRLTNHSSLDGFASWSPTGAKIAFTSTRHGNSEIYSMNADGTVVTRLTNHSSIDASPSWAPNGLKIAFTSTRHGNVEIYSMNPDGTGVTRLTNHGDEDAFPTWSPDSTRIAFASNRSGGINFEIYSMNANGTGITRLTNNSAIDVEPAWGTNGKIAFTSTRNFGVEIYSMNSNGTGVTRLTNNPFWVLDVSPHW